MNEKMLTMQLQPFIDELGVSIDPFMPVEKLPAYKRVMVELLRAIVAGYHLIIIREISTVISEDELGNCLTSCGITQVKDLLSFMYRITLRKYSRYVPEQF